MLFAHPTPASAQGGPAAPTAGCGRVPELGYVFTSGRTGALGTARPSVHLKTAVRPAFHGWLAGRRPETFLAGRKGFLGTVPLSLFNSAVRAASGWLFARTTDDFPCERTGALGTARLPFIPIRMSDPLAMAGWWIGVRWKFSKPTVRTPRAATIFPCFRRR